MNQVGVLHYPWGEDLGLAELPPGTPRRVLRRALAYRANPRPATYMEALLNERHPHAKLVRTTEAGWEDEVRGADRVVLLFPDSIGLGFGALERRLATLVQTTPIVLNGRRRELVLDPRTERSLQLRRLLERSMLVEVVGLVVLAAATPLLLAADALRGRR